MKCLNTPRNESNRSSKTKHHQKFIITFEKKYRELFKCKYQTNETTYNVRIANNLICNEKCRIVAWFKDYLILDDAYDYVKKLYTTSESLLRLNKIVKFYETYSKIFPNYIIFPESVYLYKNIRKKQKMIDAFNQIKLEEEENRKQIVTTTTKGNECERVFDSDIMESILRCQPSFNSGKMDQSNITINPKNTGIRNISPTNSMNYNRNIIDHEESTISIKNMIHLLDRPVKKVEDGNNNNNVDLITETNKKLVALFKEKILSKTRNDKKMKTKAGCKRQDSPKKQNGYITSNLAKAQQGCPGNSTKTTVGINIISNVNTIIVPQGSTVININNNYFNYDVNSLSRKTAHIQSLSPIKKEQAQAKSTERKQNNNHNLFANNIKRIHTAKKVDNKTPHQENTMVVYTKTEGSQERRNKPLNIKESQSGITNINASSSDYLAKLYLNKLNHKQQRSKQPTEAQQKSGSGIFNKITPMFMERGSHSSLGRCSALLNKRKKADFSRVFSPNQTQLKRAAYQSPSMIKQDVASQSVESDMNQRNITVQLSEATPTVMVSMQTEGNMASHRNIRDISNNETKRRYKEFLERNKLQCLSTRISCETGSPSKVRNSFQLLNAFNSQKCGIAKYNQIEPMKSEIKNDTVITSPRPSEIKKIVELPMKVARNLLSKRTPSTDLLKGKIFSIANSKFKQLRIGNQCMKSLDFKTLQNKIKGIMK